MVKIYSKKNIEDLLPEDSDDTDYDENDRIVKPKTIILYYNFFKYPARIKYLKRVLKEIYFEKLYENMISCENVNIYKKTISLSKPIL